MEGFKALIFVWCVWVCLLSQSFLGAAKVRHYNFDVEYIYKSVDCLEHVVMGINGQLPGPTIRAEVGDTLDIVVNNKLVTEGTSIHWHGIRQIGTPWADGTASISQCPIKPGESFRYKFVVDKAGTYFYHGHYGMQREAGLYGSIIVDLPKGQKEPFHYDGEFNLLLSDFWHTSHHEHEIGLLASPLRWPWEPRSLLINGRGQYGCSLAAGLTNSTSLPLCKLKGSEECAPYILHVEPNKTYRVRITSTASLTGLYIAINDHKMTVVEADGNYVVPFSVDGVDIYSGESYSVLIHTYQNSHQNYWISLGPRDRNTSTPQALTLLNYNTVSASVRPPFEPPITPVWSDLEGRKNFTKQIFSLKGTPLPPKHTDRRIVLLGTQNLFKGATKWSVNNVSLDLPPTPYLGAIKFRLKKAFNWTTPPENYPQDYDITSPPVYPNTTIGNGVYMLKLNTTVDLIIQNANALGPRLNSGGIHPWHLHGHDFWVLGYGEGKFKDGDEKYFNLKNPPLRNTCVVFPYGWTALRFRADNPGAWIFHCHLEPHLHQGMGVVFAEGIEYVKGIPSEALACGLTAKRLMKNRY